MPVRVGTVTETGLLRGAQSLEHVRGKDVVVLGLPGRWLENR
jgi:hypothetical protein